jgi:hypothetical protein
MGRSTRSRPAALSDGQCVAQLGFGQRPQEHADHHRCCGEVEAPHHQADSPEGMAALAGLAPRHIQGWAGVPVTLPVQPTPAPKEDSDASLAAARQRALAMGAAD